MGIAEIKFCLTFTTQPINGSLTGAVIQGNLFAFNVDTPEIRKLQFLSAPHPEFLETFAAKWTFQERARNRRKRVCFV